jgi:hypothetical protein
VTPFPRRGREVGSELAPPAEHQQTHESCRYPAGRRFAGSDVTPSASRPVGFDST